MSGPISGKRWTYLALILILGLLVTVFAGGCLSGEKAAAPAKQEQPAQAKQDSGDGINIGILVPYTGELGSYGNYWFKGAKLATDEINAAGPPLGKQIKLFTEDTETSVEQGIRGAKKLITANKVIAMNGPESTVAVAILDFAKENGVVIACPAAGSTKLNDAGGPFLFRTCPSDDFDGKASAKMLWAECYKKVSIIYENDEGRASIGEAVAKEFEKLGGQVVAKIPYAPRQTSYLPELKKAFADKPDALFLAGGQESGPTIMKEWNQRGYGGRLMVSADLAVPELFGLVDPKVLEGSLGEIPRAREDTPQYQSFAKRWQEAYKEPPGGAYESNAYDGQIILALAIESAKQATGKGISEHYQKVASPPGKVVTSYQEGIKELRAGNDINYEGASGPCDFNQYGNVTGSYAALKAQNGKWTEYKFYPAEQFKN